jgi:hypothetical protein
MNEIISLRKKFVNSTLINKTCSSCNKTYPRTKEFFYQRKHQSSKNSVNFEPSCITCSIEKSIKWKQKNKTKKKESDYKYKNSEKGYFRELFQSVKKSKHGSEFKNYDEFFNCWKKQERTYGMKCPYTGIEMTRIKATGFKGKTTSTNISKDRILSSRPYSKKNLMFISWGVNNSKGNISPKIAKRFLEIVKERFGTDDIE